MTIAPYAAAPSALSDGSDAGTGALTDSANTETFLQLLVVQIRNQDPLNPQDPTGFVSQLAEFSSLEQLLEMRKSLDVLAEAVQTAPESPAEIEE